MRLESMKNKKASPPYVWPHPITIRAVPVPSPCCNCGKQVVTARGQPTYRVQ